jgi:hypothetical protein
MVPHQAVQVAGGLEGANPFDHPARVRATIDEIAQEYELCPRGSTLDIVFADAADQIVEQIEPAVHVAHGIDALPVRNAVGGLRLSGPGKKAS